MSNELFKKMHIVYQESKKYGMSRIDVDVCVLIADYITKKKGLEFEQIKWDQKTKNYLSKEDCIELYKKALACYYVEENQKEKLDILKNESDKELAILAGYIANCIKK